MPFTTFSTFLIAGVLQVGRISASLFYFILVWCQDRVSLNSPGCSEAHYVHQDGLEPPASPVLGLMVCTSMTSLNFFIFTTWMMREQLSSGQDLTEQVGKEGGWTWMRELRLSCGIIWVPLGQH